MSPENSPFSFSKQELNQLEDIAYKICPLLQQKPSSTFGYEWAKLRSSKNAFSEKNICSEIMEIIFGMRCALPCHRFRIRFGRSSQKEDVSFESKWTRRRHHTRMIYVATFSYPSSFLTFYCFYTSSASCHGDSSKT